MPALLALGVLAWLFYALVRVQARSIGGHAPLGEVGWKMLHVASIFVLYSLWSRAWTFVAAGLGASLRWMSLARGAAIVCFAPFVFSSFNVHRTKIGNGTDPLRDQDLAFQTVWFRSQDGLPLHGWWIPAAAPTSRSVVVCHGIGTNSGNFLSGAPFLHRAGFNVLFFDFRGHGDSGGHTTSFGFYEANDVHAACKYLQQQGQSKIALYGFSMGGAAVSLAFDKRFSWDTAFDSNVRAVVLDSTFAAFEPVVDNQLSLLPAWSDEGPGCVFLARNRRVTARHPARERHRPRGAAPSAHHPREGGSTH